MNCVNSSSKKPMIEVLLPAHGARRWQADMIAGLRRGGYALRVLTGEPAKRVEPTGVTLLMMLERLTYRLSAIQPSSLLPKKDVQRLVTSEYEGVPDVTIDFTGHSAAPGNRIVPFYDGCPDEAAAIAAIFAGRAPIISIVNDGQVIAQGIPGIEVRHIITLALDCVFVRTAALIRHAIKRKLRKWGQEEWIVCKKIAVAKRSLLQFEATVFAARLQQWLTLLARKRNSWKVAWRFVQNDAVISTLHWPTGGYTIVKDDGKRYFADPFVFEHGGVSYVFCEEYQYERGKGVISYFIIGRNGATTMPRVVIDAPYHLSYPFVFSYSGDIYMLPESSAAQTIEIWRAERFPDKWVKVAELISGIGACDATLIEHEGRLWLFATIAGDGATSWDTLELFHAQSLFGPWQAHSLNPVVVDACSARPGGIMLNIGGKIRRVAQYNLERYGGGLSFCTVEQLDPENYLQCINARLQPPTASGTGGVHTLNMAGQIEVIDLFGP